MIYYRVKAEEQNALSRGMSLDMHYRMVKEIEEKEKGRKRKQS